MRTCSAEVERRSPPRAQHVSDRAVLDPDEETIYLQEAL